MNNFDIKRFEELTEQIKQENPKIDIEMCKYIAGSYLIYDVMGLEKPIDELEQYKRANEIIEGLKEATEQMSIEISA